MPEVANYETEDDWMAACVPARIDEGPGIGEEGLAVLEVRVSGEDESQVTGGRLVVPASRDPDVVVRAIAEEQVSLLPATPSSSPAISLTPSCGFLLASLITFTLI